MKKQSKQQQQNKQKKAHKEGKEIPVPILYFFDTRTDLDARAETFLFFFLPLLLRQSVDIPRNLSSHGIATIGFLRASLGFWERGFFWLFRKQCFPFFFLTLTAYRPTPLVGASERFLLPWVLCRHAR